MIERLYRTEIIDRGIAENIIAFFFEKIILKAIFNDNSASEKVNFRSL